jgi:hypothetical protein
MSQSVSEFFKEKKERLDAEAGAIDWDARKREWVAAVDQLVEKIREFLADPVKEGLLKVDTRPKSISESHLGEYTVPELVLTVGDEEVIFSPKARNVAGAQGRVDVRGEAGEATLVRQPGRWSVVTSRHPQLKTVDLDSDSFVDLLRAVSRA